jgi:putative MFS transporter
MTITADALTDKDFARAGATPVFGSVAIRMDGLSITRLHILIIVIAAFGFAFDLMEVALGNALSAVFSAPPYSADATHLAILLSAMYIGAIPGAALAGLIADKLGRKLVLMGVLALLAVTSTAAAASPDINVLIAMRVLSGMAIGAFPPLIIAYLTDIMPPRQRGMIIMIVSGLAALGPVGIIFFIRWLTPIVPFGIEGWRWAFLLGAVGSAVIAIVMRWLPESPRWLAAQGRHAEAEAAIANFEKSAVAFPVTPVPVVEAAPKADNASVEPFSRRKFAVLSGIYFLAPWAVVAFPLLMGAVLIEKGFKLSDSLLYVGLSMFGPVIGTILAAFFLDRFERRTALAAFAVVMIIAGIGFAMSLEPAWLMVTALAFQITSLLYVPTLSIYAAEIVPTAYRGRTSATAWSVNRLASAIAPLLLLPLLKNVGVGAMFSVIIVALVLGLVLVIFFADRGKAAQAVD